MTPIVNGNLVFPTHILIPNYPLFLRELGTGLKESCHLQRVEVHHTECLSGKQCESPLFNRRGGSPNELDHQNHLHSNRMTREEFCVLFQQYRRPLQTPLRLAQG
jgi:hypothetical protein